MGGVDAYTVDIGGEVTVRNDDRSESERFAGVSEVNATSERIAVRLERPEETSVYLADRTAYARCPASEYANVEDVWYAARELDRNRSFRSFTELGTGRVPRSGRASYDGNRTLDGERVHVVSVVPDEDVYAEAKSRAVYPNGEPSNQGTLKNASIRLWIDADTKRLLRAELTERRSVDGTTLRVRQTLEYRYGPVSIELPETVVSEAACPDP